MEARSSTLLNQRLFHQGTEERSVNLANHSAAPGLHACMCFEVLIYADDAATTAMLRRDAESLVASLLFRSFQALLETVDLRKPCLDLASRFWNPLRICGNLFSRATDTPV